MELGTEKRDREREERHKMEEGGANGERLKRKENMVEQKEKPRRAVTKLMGRNLRKMENAKRGDNAIRGG